MTLADLAKAHYPTPWHDFKQIWCKCGAKLGWSENEWANHFQDAILATYPALAGMLPETDCHSCGTWYPRNLMTHTRDGDWICHNCTREEHA